LPEFLYKLLGEDEKKWQTKFFYEEVGRPGNPDTFFMLLLASPRRRGEEAQPNSVAVEIYSKLVNHYSRNHLVRDPRRMVRELVEIVGAESAGIRESKTDLAAGFLHLKGRRGAAGSIGRLRAGFAGQNGIVASSPVVGGSKGRSAEGQVSLDFGETVERDLDELPAFFIAPSSATAVGEEPMRKFVWDFVSDEAGLADKAPASWEHVPCLVGLAAEPSEEVPPAEPGQRPHDPKPATVGDPAPSRRLLYWISGIAAALVVAVTAVVLTTREPGAPGATSVTTQAVESERADSPSDAPPAEADARAIVEEAREGAREGASEEPAPETDDGAAEHAGVSLSLEWRKSFGQVLTSSPVAFGDALAFGSRGGAVYCVSKADGSKRWTFKGPDGFGSSPDVWSGRLYIGCYDGSIFCLDTGDGSELWRYRTGGKVVCSPVVTEGGRVLVGSFDGKLYCLSADGDLLWDFNSGSRIWASPRLEGSSVLVGDLGGRVHCLDLNTGRPRWAESAGGEIYGSPVVREGAAYFGSSNGKVIAFSTDDGRRIWEHARRGSVSSSLALAPDALIAGFEDKTLAALAPADGKVIWETALPGPVRSKPVTVGRFAAVTCFDGSVVLVDILTGAVAAGFKAEDSVYATPVVSGGIAYFGDMKGDFTALALNGLPSD